MMRLKKKKKPILKIKSMGLWLVLLLVFILELFSYTWCRVQCIRLGYEIAKETKNHQRLVTLQNNLKIELASLKSPERLAEIAKHKFNLKIPTSKQVIVIP
jgi:cell division protein FtsL